MFKNTLNWSYKRSVKEAVGFYIVYLLAIMVAGGASGFVAAMIFATDAESGYEVGYRAGLTVSVVVSVGLAYLIAKSKGLLRNWFTILLILVSAMLAALGGGLLGLIVPAYLSTRESRNVTPVGETVG